MDSTRGGYVSDSDTSSFFEIGVGPPEFIEATSRYHLRHELGRGGMGVVYSARDLVLHRDVAVKILVGGTSTDNGDAAAQFVNEARIMGRLQHPGIAHVYDYGLTEQGRPFHAMKLVEGDTLASLLDQRAKSVAKDSLSLGFDSNGLPSQGVPLQRVIPQSAQLLNVFASVCQAIAYTHSKHVVHLDLKPANIMVGEFGEVYVMDWGLARSVDALDALDALDDLDDLDDSDKTNDGRLDRSRGVSLNHRVQGTLQYMAPEQARGQRVNKQTDVFCLGAVLCEILTGHPPYNGASREQVLRQARNAELRFAHRRLDRSAGEKTLVRLAKRCLQADPVDRPWDATLLAQEMSRHSQSGLERLRNDMTQFFELSLDLFCIAGFDGFFRRVNRNFSRVLGYSNKELMARPFISFVHADDLSKTLGAMEQLIEGRPIVEFRNRYLDRSGNALEFEWTAKSIVEDGVIFAVARKVR